MRPPRPRESSVVPVGVGSFLFELSLPARSAHPGASTDSSVAKRVSTGFVEQIPMSARATTGLAARGVGLDAAPADPRHGESASCAGAAAGDHQLDPEHAFQDLVEGDEACPRAARPDPAGRGQRRLSGSARPCWSSTGGGRVITAHCSASPATARIGSICSAEAIAFTSRGCSCSPRGRTARGRRHRNCKEHASGFHRLSPNTVLGATVSTPGCRRTDRTGPGTFDELEHQQPEAVRRSRGSLQVTIILKISTKSSKTLPAPSHRRSRRARRSRARRFSTLGNAAPMKRSGSWQRRSTRKRILKVEPRST